MKLDDVMEQVRDVVAGYDDTDKEKWADMALEELCLLVLSYDMEKEYE